MTPRRHIPALAAALAGGLLVAGSVALIGIETPAAADRARERPNIVMVVTDDQTLASYNAATMPQTTRRLAGRGTTFTDAIVTTPLCCPARATFLTGQYAHNHGVLQNDYRLLRGKRNILPVWLERAGYRTIHVGKYLNRYSKARSRNRVDAGWTDWHTVVDRYDYYDYVMRVNGSKRRYGDRPRDHLTRVLNRKAVRLIRAQAERRRPFYLQLDHYAPHIAPGRAGDRCEKAAVPDPRDEGLFAGEPLPRPPSFNEDDVSDKPSFIRGLPQLGSDEIDELERRYGCALASLRAVDRGIGEIVKALRKTGQLKRTVVVFVSDNGFFAGEHRIPDAKQNPYEEALRVPLVVRVPKRLLAGGSRVRSVDSQVANTDVTATILDLAGAEPCKRRRRCRTIDGRSLMPLVEGRRGAWPRDRALVVELGRKATNAPVLGGRACTYSGVRTRRWVYVEHTHALNPATRACEPVDDVEMYDLRDDPFQLESLAASAPHAGRRQRLAERLAKLRDCAGIKGRDPRPPSGSWCE